MRELILYATPVGPLAEQCNDYFERVGARGMATTAQAYPPHCTLTGFFHRIDLRAEAAITDAERIVVNAGPVPPTAVDVVSLITNEDWIGFELRSPWLREVTESFAAEHRREGDDHRDEDALRIKDWLHLSLAYGVEDLAPHRELAEAMIDPAAAVGWEVALWERFSSGGWVRHTAPIVGASGDDRVGQG